MIVENVHFSINGTNVNDAVSGASVSVSSGRGYNVATLESDKPFNLGSEVHIVLGIRRFSGFVYRVGRTKSNLYTIECRSDTARLTMPFDPDQDIFEPATTATALCRLFSERSGIAIDYQSAELHFGRSFKRSGTMLDALLAVARVTGSSVTCTDDNVLTIAPRDVPDASGAVEIPDADVIEFVSDTGSLESFGISELLISSDSAAVTTRQKHSIEVDNCTGRFVMYAVPRDGVVFSHGVGTTVEDVQQISEENTLDNADYVELKAEIEAIEKVTVNGFEISGYTHEDCFVSFAPKVTGKVVVTYAARVIRGQVLPSVTPAGVWWLVRGEHNGEPFSEQGFLECNNQVCDPLPCVNGTDDACVFMPERRNYVEGFSFWVHGGAPIARSIGAELNIVQSSELFVATADVQCEHFSGAQTPAETRIALIDTPTAVNRVYTEVTDTPEWTVDGRYLVFPQDYGRVKVAYTLQTEKFSVRGEDQPVEVKVEVANACGGVTGFEYWKQYDVEGFNKYDLSSYPCILGEPIPVDIAGELGVIPFNAAGRAVDAGDLGIFTVDEFGFIFVTPLKNGVYKIDCRTVVHGGEVVLKVNI